MRDVAYADVTTTLLERLPELRDEFDEERSKWTPDEVHAHVVYGSVLARFIDRMEIASRTEDGDECERILRRVFALVEDIATSSDFESRCVIEASLLEALLGEGGGWKRYSRFFGRSTMALAERVRDRFAG